MASDEEENLLETLLKEYEARNNEIRMRMEDNSRLLNYLLTILGVSGVALIPLHGKSETILWPLLLGVSFILSCLAAGLMHNDMMIATNGDYIDKELRPQLSRLVNQPVLKWERFLRDSMRHPLRRHIWALSPILSSFPIGAVPIFFLVLRSSSASWYELVMFVIDVIVLICLGLGAWFSQRDYLNVAQPLVPASTPPTLPAGTELLSIDPPVSPSQ